MRMKYIACGILCWMNRRWRSRSLQFLHGFYGASRHGSRDWSRPLTARSLFSNFELRTKTRLHNGRALSPELRKKSPRNTEYPYETICLCVGAAAGSPFGLLKLPASLVVASKDAPFNKTSRLYQIKPRSCT
ncbi:hypothetical protein HYPSUDRAFT_1015619 [Hypholoma sublateritium FD-334 SS-4]|uniref:Uncharacterized protein n=1 Tax=Hypholoma sublateritium (strain FD-334 SS-4) TaxID=945553 RepID=A0A0D2NLK1_HYPSF|nr:hypothetical protein HYPSUDRAFT_1015619 [Hypholoma sublateritium FD-334 SS-4]